MDPLSIATAAVGTTKVLYRASSTIYDFISDAKIVDKKLEKLRSEFESTARILEVVKTRLRNPIHLIHARSQDHQGFLDIALASIQECDNASTEVIAKIEGIGEGAAWLKSRTMRQIQYKRMQKDILRANTRIQDQKQNLQLLIQMLDVLLTHQSTALLTEKVLPPLSSLQLLIEKASTSGAEVYIHPAKDGHQSALTTRTRTMPEATSTTSAAEPTIPEPVIPEPGDGEADDGEAYNGTDEDEEPLPDQDDVRTIQAFQTKAAALLESKAYADAEKAFLNCLKLYEVLPIDSLPISSMVHAQLGLATACMHQEKWSQAKDLFQFLASFDDDVQAQCQYHLAQIHLAEHEFDKAYTACLEARVKFQSARERSDCTALLVLIAQTNEDEAAAIIYARGLTNDEPDWSALPFYRFTAKGHGLSIDTEKDALAYIKSWPDNTQGYNLANASLSGNTAAVKFLLWQGAPLNVTFQPIKDQGGMTALMAAARKGHLSIVRSLLRAGADVDVGCHGYKARSRGYFTIKVSALHHAVVSKSGPITRIILEALTPNKQDYLDAMDVATYNEFIGPLEVLLAHEGIREIITQHEMLGRGVMNIRDVQHTGDSFRNLYVKERDFLGKAVSDSKLLTVRSLLAANLFVIDDVIMSLASRIKSEGANDNGAAVYQELINATKK